MGVLGTAFGQRPSVPHPSDPRRAEPEVRAKAEVAMGMQPEVSPGPFPNHLLELWRELRFENPSVRLLRSFRRTCLWCI